MKTNFPQTEAFLKHIFGNQLELFYDYMTLTINQPKQKLPILYLVSEHHSNGKTVFLKYIESFFENDCVIISQNEIEDLLLDGTYADKLIISIDEFASPIKRETFDKIHEIASTRIIGVNKKYKDYKEIDFQGRFIIASNSEEQPEFYQYWKIVIPELKTEREPLLLAQLISEELDFFVFLRNREISTKPESRLWFNSEILTENTPREKLLFKLRPGQIALILDSEKDLQKLQEAMIIADDAEATEYFEPFLKNAKIIKA